MGVIDGIRHPLIIVAVYNIITAVHTGIKAFYYTKSLADESDSSTNVVLRLYCSQGVLACLSLIMSVMLIVAKLKTSHRLLVAWVCWETAYLIAFTLLAIFICKKGTKVVLNSPIQYAYTVLPRLFEIFCIILVVSYYLAFKRGETGPSKMDDNPFSYRRHANELEPKA